MDAAYEFADAAARERFSQSRPLRAINRDLGYPIAVVDEDGEFVKPTPEDFDEKAFEAAQNERWRECVEARRKSGWPRLENRASHVHGEGVFAAQDIPASSPAIGYYNGTVYTEEAWDDVEDDRDENFLFNLNDGAHGVVVDGKVGKEINALQFLNHSCAPNVRMQEVFLDGSWGVLVVALRDIKSGEELTHDFALHTEDPQDAVIPCTCGSSACRKTLFAYFAWN